MNNNDLNPKLSNYKVTTKRESAALLEVL